MNARRSWYVGGITAGAVLAAAAYVVCASLAWLGRTDGPSVAERQDRLSADEEHLYHLRETIRCCAADVAEGRLGLRAAAAAVRAANEGGPKHLDLHVEYLPGRTEEERYCRSVLAHVQTYLEGDPRAPAVLARLEKELHRSLPAPRPAHARAGRPSDAGGA